VTRQQARHLRVSLQVGRRAAMGLP